MRLRASARLNAWLPRRSDVQARSGDGSILVEHLNGKIDLHTGDGSIRATDMSGELTFRTGDGSVTVDDVQGRLAWTPETAASTCPAMLGSVTSHTGDGSIVYRAQPRTAMTDDWDITTGDGGVSLYLPSDFVAELDAHTGDGADPKRSRCRCRRQRRKQSPHGTRPPRRRRPSASHPDRRRRHRLSKPVIRSPIARSLNC